MGNKNEELYLNNSSSFVYLCKNVILCQQVYRSQEMFE